MSLQVTFTPIALSDDDGFAVFAEDPAKRIGNLADCSLRFDRRQNCRHKILSATRAALHFGDRSASCRIIAASTQRLQTSYLSTLDFGVDAQCGNGLHLDRLKTVDANDDLVAP